MRIFVLGKTGMLGRYVSTYLSQFYVVVSISRHQIDAANVNEQQIADAFGHIGIDKNDVVINCVGTIKPRVDELGDLNAIQVNSVFPRLLANVCEARGIHMIHPTTDCVYTGLKGEYIETDKYDVSDVYGMSKALGEPKNCTVIRTSIIGEEVGQGRSLVEWVKSSKGKTVNGFTNHFWNGITCLQFAKICKQMIEANDFWNGIKHLHSNTLTKAALVQTISEVYDLNLEVKTVEAPMFCDRSISTLYKTSLEGFKIPSLYEQIKEMKGFSDTLYGKEEGN